MKRYLSFVSMLLVLLILTACNEKQPTRSDEQIQFKAGHIYAQIKGKVGLSDGRIIEAYEKPKWIELGPMEKALYKSGSTEGVCEFYFNEGVCCYTIYPRGQLTFYWDDTYIPTPCISSLKTWKHRPLANAKVIAPQNYSAMLAMSARVKDGPGNGGGGSVDLTSSTYYMYVPYNYCAHADGYWSSAYNHDFDGQFDEVWLYYENLSTEATIQTCIGTQNGPSVHFREQ